MLIYKSLQNYTYFFNYFLFNRKFFVILPSNYFQSKMKKETENPIYARNTLEFVTVSAEFCAYLEKPENRKRGEFIDTMLKLLPLLYLKAQMLPEVDSMGDFLPDDQVTYQDYQWVRETVAQLMQEADEYEDLTIDEGTQGIVNRWKSISEGIADIWQPLRNFVTVYQQRVEACMLDALWSVSDSFELYWGEDVLSTLRQLHRIKYVLNSNGE